MMVRTTKDWEYLPAGSVLQKVRVNKHTYHGLWCSPEGSYWITIPKMVAESTT